MTPARIGPTRIHSKAGSQPNVSPARIGPTMGPAAAMAEKCWLSKNFASIGA